MITSTFPKSGMHREIAPIKSLPSEASAENRSRVISKTSFNKTVQCLVGEELSTGCASLLLSFLPSSSLLFPSVELLTLLENCGEFS